MCNKDSITSTAIQEIENKKIVFTNQFLRVHELVYVDENPVIDNINNNNNETIDVYFKVKNQNFYFVVFILKENDVLKVINSDALPFVSVALKAHSKILSLIELNALTTLSKSYGVNKGEKKVKGGSVEWRESRLIIEPFIKPSTIERKLENTLEYLETDRKGVTDLGSSAQGHIGVRIEYYISNSYLGGFLIKKNYMDRISRLNLDLDLQLYASGKHF